MAKRKSNTQEAPIDRSLLVDELSQLEGLLSDLQSNFTAEPIGKGMKAEEKKARLAKARRELLKAKNRLDALNETFDETLSLDFVDADEAKAIMEVVELRKSVTDDYYRAYCLISQFAKISQGLGATLKGQILEKVTALSTRATDVRKGLFQIYWALPDLGMTNAEWESMSLMQRRSLRPTGRPSLPLECQISECKSQIDTLMAEINALSKGSISTIEKALKGVELSNRGRPAISEIGKLERHAGRLRRDLERLDPNDFPSEEENAEKSRPVDTYQARATRLKARIEEIEDEIRIKESELEGVAVYRRELEKQRARHRDLVVLESKTSTAEQASLLLNILTNELQQEETVLMIRQLDPQASETLTHRVNPKETRDRLARVEANTRLTDSEELRLQEIKESIFGKGSARGR